ncbi:MAG TPA: hypothetical protein VF821_12765 [Lentzea sp.]
MTTLSTIPVDEITAQAREVKPGRTALTVVAAVLFGLGWVTARVFSVVWLAAMWSGVAVREGWRASHGPSRSQRLAAQAGEIEDLKAALSRFSG